MSTTARHEGDLASIAAQGQVDLRPMVGRPMTDYATQREGPEPIPDPAAKDPARLERWNRYLDHATQRAEQGPISEPELHRRLARLERWNRRLSYALFGCVAAVMALALFMVSVNARSTVEGQAAGLGQSQEIKLVDAAGRSRLLLRMYSGLPIMQLMDEGGQTRLAFGLRFDNAPFVDLSDGSGKTRASLFLNDSDEPALRLFDKDGAATFSVN